MAAMPATIMMSKKKLLMRVKRKLFVYCFLMTFFLWKKFTTALTMTAASTPRKKLKP